VSSVHLRYRGGGRTAHTDYGPPKLWHRHAGGYARPV